LLAAVKARDYALASWAVENERVDLSCKDEDGNSPLSLAVSDRNPDLDFVKKLLAKGADRNWQGKMYGRQLTHLAAEAGNLELVKLLWEQGLSFSVEDSSGWTTLTFAVRCSHNSVIDFIHEKNPDLIKQRTTHANSTMLHIAVVTNLKMAEKVYRLIPD